MHSVIFWAFALIAGYFLIMEHRAHVFEYLPFLLLAACPLLHLLHGHGGHGAHGKDAPKKTDPGEASKDADGTRG